MKLFITIFVLAANILLISCRKTRTCSCEYDTTITTTTTPRNGGTATVVANTSSGENKNTLSKVKKDDLERLLDCNSRSESSVNTYTDTEMISVTTVSTVMGFTFTVNSYSSVTVDVSRKNETEYECEIK